MIIVEALAFALTAGMSVSLVYIMARDERAETRRNAARRESGK